MKRPPIPQKPIALRSATLSKGSQESVEEGKEANAAPAALHSSFLQLPSTSLRSARSNPEFGSKSEAKYNRIARELIETEISYLQDLKVLKQLFYDNANFAADQKILFTGLIEVLHVSEVLVKSMNDKNIAKIFLDQMNLISDSYCLYCKSNEQALQKIKEYNQESHPLYQILISTQLEMKGRTNAWDLSSMIVKPVQRVLKYPLLLKRLAEEDFDEKLKQAVLEMNNVADLINEVKKRKDVVEKYATKSNKNIVHGFNKKLSRQTQKFLNAIEGESKTDSRFDNLCKDFDATKDLLTNLEKQINSWTQSLKNLLATEHALASGLENLFLLDRTNSYTDMQKLVAEYRISKEVCLDSSFKMVEVRTKSTCKIIHRGLEMCTPVLKIIRKRNDKQLDYERLLGIRAKGETPDPQLIESGDEFLAMNALVIEEIPKFIDCVGKLAGVVMDDLVSLHEDFCLGYLDAGKDVGRVFLVEGFGGFERISNDYYAAMAPGREAELSCRRIELLSKWKDSVWGSGKFSTSVHVGVSRAPSFSSLPPSRDVSLIDFSAVTLSPPSQGHNRSSSLCVGRSGSQDRNVYQSSILIPKQLHFKVRCLYNFQAETADELSMDIGDVIEVDANVDRGAEGWWFGSSANGSGWIPSNFVEKL